MTGVAMPLVATDALLIQRVARHVLQAQVEERLASVRWHEGLGADEVVALRLRWPLPTALWDELDGRPTAATTPEPPLALLAPLMRFLRSRRSGVDPAFGVLANVLGSACFGSHHLWQDLGAAGRDEVSRLMRIGFVSLHDANHRDLRWKRHLFLMLGEDLGRAELRPPKCGDCDQFEACFGAPPPSEPTPT